MGKNEDTLLNYKKTILVIDDLKLNFLVVKNVLSQFPTLTVNYVQDPRLTSDEIMKNKPDLILLDYEMPHINGPELCKMLKRHSVTQNIPVLFFTAASAADTIQTAFVAGADDYLNKPICEPELISRIIRIFQNQALSEKLKEKYEEQAAISRLLSHDLGNYISVIKTSSQSLKRHLEPNFPKFDQFMGYVARCEKTVTRMEELVHNVRKIQAMNDQKVSLELSADSLVDLVLESVGNYHEKIESKKIVIKYNDFFLSDKGKDTKVFFEKISALNSVLGNVLSNAIKFSFEGSLVEISLEDLEGQVALHFRDHGLGMSPELVQKVFSKTEKTTRLGTNKEAGTGFGMPLVKMFMLSYGGDVNVASKDIELTPEDHGTTVTLLFKKAEMS